MATKAERQQMANLVLETADADDADDPVVGLQRIADASPDVRARLTAIRMLTREVLAAEPPDPRPKARWKVVAVPPGDAKDADV